ncbi:DUF3568 family protein [Oceanidesulfovibrio indonesiensis]|nr:DUF3568 family protein [Oceanidesulfovibrio indonesiensis]
MAVTNRLTVFCALLLMVLLFGCAGMQSGVNYDYSDGWLAYEYDAPMDRAYKSSIHGAFRQHVAFDELTWEPGAELTGTMDGQPVALMFEEAGPSATLVSVKVTESGNPDASRQIHESIQEYLVW